MEAPIPPLKPCKPSRACRTWAHSAGYDVGQHGLLPEHLYKAWANAGAPFPAGTRPDPADWTLADLDPGVARNNGRRKKLVKDGRTGAKPAPSAFQQPQQATDAVLAVLATGAVPTFEIDLVSSGTARVQTLHEVTWWNTTRDKYLEQNRMTEVADLVDLDRLLLMELQVYRTGQWLMSGVDYQGNDVDQAALHKQLKETADSIAKLKDAMGLSKRSRDATASGVAERWADILRRGKAWNYHRVEQVQTALLLMGQLSARIGTYDRSDEEERRIEGIRTPEDLLEWIRSDMLPRYREVDEYFLEHQQSTWGKSG